MELHRLPADEAMHQPGRLVDRGWARALYRGPRTPSEILAEARDEMDAQDAAEARARDPLAWVRAHRPRRRLIDVLLGRQ